MKISIFIAVFSVILIVSGAFFPVGATNTGLSVTQVLGEPTEAGRVLGAAALAQTGMQTQKIYLTLMALGSITFGIGLIAFKKSSKNAQ